MNDIKQRSVDGSIRYFVEALARRAAETGDLDLGGLAMALGMTADRAAAEIAELRTQLDTAERQLQRLDRALGETIDDRDHFHEMADKLAYAVAPEEVIGEHSSMNCPWENALDLITPMADVAKLRQENADYERALGINEETTA